jgi:arginine decarboxylase
VKIAQSHSQRVENSFLLIDEIMNLSVFDQFQTPILSALLARSRMSHYRFYTPGHKGGQGASPGLIDLLGMESLMADLTELPGLDQLSAPQGVILQAQELAAVAFGAEQTWFLINGSTCGVMAALLATCAPGDRVILPRNAHQSAIAGLILSGANPVFINPEFDPQTGLVHNVATSTVALALSQYPDAKAILLVSPTYEGICADVVAIAELAHQHQIPLLVDEAHGAHFGFHPQLPTAALAAGADLVVQSTHKVLAALTQASMLHVQGERIDRQKLGRSLQLLQSSSPSYLLLASLDAARQQMALQGEVLLGQTLELSRQARAEISQIPRLSVVNLQAGTSKPGFTDLDLTRLTVRVNQLGLTGFEADEILQQSGVIAELATLDYLTFIISLGNTAADIQALVASLQTLATTHYHQPIEKFQANFGAELPLVSVPQISPQAAFQATAETVAIADAIGRISAEFVCPYPPGIPMLLPGEFIEQGAIAFLQHILSCGGSISGCSDLSLKTLKVI